MKIAYFGTEASNTHLAALKIFPDSNFVSEATISDCFSAVISGKADAAVVPLENSIEGTVSLTLDLLYSFEEIFINAEVVMPIAHQLMVHGDNQKVEKIYSHPQAIAQCGKFITENYPNAIIQEFASTSAAAKRVAENTDKNYAAIANSHAAKTYGLKIIQENIQDFEQNHTKFIVVSKNPAQLSLLNQKISEKTALLITLPEDHAGGLHQVLSVFAWRKMNLTKIESRTKKTGLGSYFFFITVEGDWNNPLYYNALAELDSIGVGVKNLASYGEYLLH